MDLSDIDKFEFDDDQVSRHPIISGVVVAIISILALGADVIIYIPLIAMVIHIIIMDYVIGHPMVRMFAWAYTLTLATIVGFLLCMIYWH